MAYEICVTSVYPSDLKSGSTSCIASSMCLAFSIKSAFSCSYSGISSLQDNMDNDMAAVISKRTIKQNIGSDVKITEDKLWLLSHTEVFGRDDRAGADDADEFHFDFFNDERSRVKQRNGETDWWTLRTPRSGSSTTFRIVNNIGYANSYFATTAISVCFGFCIK